jgi:hypothetical protein
MLASRVRYQAKPKDRAAALNNMHRCPTGLARLLSAFVCTPVLVARAVGLGRNCAACRPVEAPGADLTGALHQADRRGTQQQQQRGRRSGTCRRSVNPTGERFRGRHGMRRYHSVSGRTVSMGAQPAGTTSAGLTGGVYADGWL